MPAPKMRLITTGGVIAVEVPDEAERTLVAQHANAVGRFLATGDIQPLNEFLDVEVAGRRLESDPDTLEAWAAQGEVEFEDIYDATGR